MRGNIYKELILDGALITSSKVKRAVKSFWSLTVEGKYKVFAAVLQRSFDKFSERLILSHSYRSWQEANVYFIPKSEGPKDILADKSDIVFAKNFRTIGGCPVSDL